MSQSRRPQKGQPTPWEYPDITSDEHVSSMRRNAVNKPMRWQFEPPEEEQVEEEEESAPRLTAEMLEAIREEGRQEGYAEGLDQGRAAGYEEGFQQGHDEGLLAGKAAGEQLAAAEAKQLQEELSIRWQQLFEHMRQPALQISEGVERQLVTMTATLAQAVCMHEISTNPLVIQQVLQRAVEELSEQAEQIKIALHPEDLALIESRWDEQERNEMGWRLLTDESLTRGGCIVTTPVTRVDATLEARINDVFRHYIQGLKGSDGQPMRFEPEQDAVSQMQQERAAEASQEVDPGPDATNGSSEDSADGQAKKMTDQGSGEQDGGTN